MKPISLISCEKESSSNQPILGKMKPLTHFHRDILRQPSELRRTLDLFAGSLLVPARAAAQLLRQSRHVFLTGIGASWNAAMAAGALFSQQARPVHMLESAGIAVK